VESPIGYQCKVCSKIHVPYHARCLRCKHTKFSEVSLPTSGILITYSVVYYSSQFELPLCLGIIELTTIENKVRYTGQLDIDISDLEVGMKVRAKWGELYNTGNQVNFGYLWEQDN
jgi:uncharacterized OB-fold protein